VILLQAIGIKPYSTWVDLEKLLRTRRAVLLSPVVSGRRGRQREEGEEPGAERLSRSGLEREGEERNESPPSPLIEKINSHELLMI
jgi:hypothetical protein